MHAGNFRHVDDLQNTRLGGHYLVSDQMTNGISQCDLNETFAGLRHNHC